MSTFLCKNGVRKEYFLTPTFIIEPYFWALDISVGLAAYLLGLAAAEWGYAMMYGVICPAVLVGAAVLYLVWRRREN